MLALDGMTSSQTPSQRIETSLVEESAMAEVDSSELTSVPDGAPIASIPDGAMPAPDDNAPAVAPSPGAFAREALLAATYQQWLVHDDPQLDELVGQLHQRGEK